MSKTIKKHNFITAAPLVVSIADEFLKKLVEENLAEWRSPLVKQQPSIFDFQNFVPQGVGPRFILIADASKIDHHAPLMASEADKYLNCALIVIESPGKTLSNVPKGFLSVSTINTTAQLKKFLEQLQEKTLSIAVGFIRNDLNNYAESALLQMSPRELEVLELVVQGHSIGEIAERLQIATPTAKIHKGKVISKSGCRNLRELILLFAPRYITDERLFK